MGMSWGGNYYMPYPMERDFSIFKEIKRLREQDGRRADAQAGEFLKKWMKKVAKHYPKNSKQYLQNERSIAFGLNLAAKSSWKDGWRLIPYSNPRGIGFLTEEFATFQDEWLNYPFFHREWDRTKEIWYDVTPSKSRIDCALWYDKKNAGML